MNHDVPDAGNGEASANGEQRARTEAHHEAKFAAAVARPGARGAGWQAWRFAANDWVPNHPRLSVLIYRAVLASGLRDQDDAHGGSDAAALDLEMLFDANGWPPQWRDVIFDYHHYHTTAHEVLGCHAGTATLVLGGPGGLEVTLTVGDVVLLPAGTGHCMQGASADFSVVGAYPPGQRFDVRRAAPSAEQLAQIAGLPFPDCDPVRGNDGPLLQLWQAPPAAP
ncbi:MAG: cupin [Janthinobacterium lividum]